ncbi:protein DR_1172 [Anabrus simplex]|uniref:protein DR_1172 n=1 Tax=Anabrus simplex TaxID=316456 RepID=UPI0035A26CAD
MFAKRIAFFVAALFVVQVSADTNSQWENVQKVFGDMIEKVENAANDVSSHIQQWAQEEQQRIDEIRDNISSKISEGMANLKEKAAEVGADVSECFQALPEDGKSVAKNLTAGAVKCVTDEVDQAKDIITSLMELAKEANATLAEASENWGECQSQSSGWKLAMCEAKVAAGAAMKEAQYSAQAGVQVSKGAKLVSTAQATMEACAAADMATAAVNAGKVMTKLGQCIMSKITQN